jgi:hypothetical protein
LDALAHLFERVAGGQDFDAQQRRMGDDAFAWQAGGEDADIGDAEAGRGDAGAGLDHHANAPVCRVDAQ